MNSQTLETAAASAFESQSAAPVEQSAPSQDGQAAPPSPQMIGIEPEQAQTKQELEWQLAQGLDPNAPIGTLNGEPLTAAQVKDHLMRQADYTRKTQEHAEQRKAYESDLAFIEENREYLQRLQSADVNERRETLLEVAKNLGIDLTPRQRDEQGRFTAQETADTELYDLSQFDDPDEREGAARWNKLTTTAREANERVAKLESIVSQLVNGVTSAHQQQQQTQEAEAIAADWASKGVQNIDTKGALAYVAKGLSMDEAMFLANKSAILAHNAKVAQGSALAQPNEPGGLTAKSTFNGQGLSLEQYAEQRLSGR